MWWIPGYLEENLGMGTTGGSAENLPSFWFSGLVSLDSSFRNVTLTAPAFVHSLYLHNAVLPARDFI